MTPREAAGVAGWPPVCSVGLGVPGCPSTVFRATPVSFREKRPGSRSSPSFSCSARLFLVRRNGAGGAGREQVRPVSCHGWGLHRRGGRLHVARSHRDAIPARRADARDERERLKSSSRPCVRAFHVLLVCAFGSIATVHVRRERPGRSSLGDDAGRPSSPSGAFAEAVKFAGQIMLLPSRDA